MKTRNHRVFVAISVAMSALAILVSGYLTSAASEPSSELSANIAPVNLVVPVAAPTESTMPVATAPRAAPTATPAISEMVLKSGNYYFSMDGQPKFFFSRNITAYEKTSFDTMLDWTKTGGSKLVRLQLDSLVMGGLGYTNTGAVDEAWARNWERVFDQAAADGVYVMPVFSGWVDWNTTGFSFWASNPLNAANGGPAQAPIELLQKDSATQELWLQWLGALIRRWQARQNIVSWEIYSEVNLTTGSTEQAAIDFVERSAAIIRQADSNHRPITASLADFGDWRSFYRSDAIDFINIHPYPTSGQLDLKIISDVRQLLATYKKPIMIGESGLSAETPDSIPSTLTTAPKASLGIKHAIWGGVVSGAMNGRALYWEDGYGIFFPALSWNYLRGYADSELPAFKFVENVDFSGLTPLDAQFSAKIAGGVLGNEKMVIGWFRDASCEPPDWNLQPAIVKQDVTITVPGFANDWQVDFYSTKTGVDIVGSIATTRQGNTVAITLPDFADDIAFKMYIPTNARTMLSTPVSTSVLPTRTPAPTLVSAPTTTDPIAGNWTGAIFGETSGFSARLDLAIHPGCKAGSVCGRVSAPQMPCNGDLELAEIQGATFVFIERNMTGATVCTSGGYEYLEQQADATLSFKFKMTAAQDQAVSSRGILKRP
jgi:hypothetical protein